jgi:hypothetical protein
VAIFYVDGCLEILFPPKTPQNGPSQNPSINLENGFLIVVWLPVFYRHYGYTSQAMMLNGFFIFISELRVKASCYRVGE